MQTSLTKLLGAAILSAACLGGSVLAEDQIWKWRDAQGVWHFSSQAPPNVTAERVSIRHSTTLPVPVANTGDSAAVGAGTKPGATTGGSADKEAFVGPESANCKAVKASIAILEASAKVSMDRDGDGQSEDLTAQEQLDELRSRQQQAKVFCAAA